MRLQRADRAGISVEERLERVEQMLRTLMSRQDRANWGKAMPEDMVGTPQPDQARKEREVARDAARRMAEDARRLAEEEANRTVKTYKRQGWDGQEQRSMAMVGKARIQELDALKQARESLEREMHNLDRQIEQLEQERQPTQKPQPRKTDEKPRAKDAESDKPAK